MTLAGARQFYTIAEFSRDWDIKLNGTFEKHFAEPGFLCYGTFRMAALQYILLGTFRSVGGMYVPPRKAVQRLDFGFFFAGDISKQSSSKLNTKIH